MYNNNIKTQYKTPPPAQKLRLSCSYQYNTIMNLLRDVHRIPCESPRIYLPYLYTLILYNIIGRCRYKNM